MLKIHRFPFPTVYNWNSYSPRGNLGGKIICRILHDNGSFYSPCARTSCSIFWIIVLLLPLWIANQNWYQPITRRKTANGKNTNISGDAVSSSVSRHKNLFYKSLKAIQLANPFWRIRRTSNLLITFLSQMHYLRMPFKLILAKDTGLPGVVSEFKFPHLTSLFL